MGIINSKLVLFENSKGQVIKDFGKKTLIWKYNNGGEFECDVKCSDLTEQEFKEMYDKMKNECSDNKIVEHAIIYCNCQRCSRVSFLENIPEKPLTYIQFNSISGRYITYNTEKINYKITGFPSQYQETINIFSNDFKKFVFSFEGVTFSAYILILRAKLE